MLDDCLIWVKMCIATLFDMVEAFSSHYHLPSLDVKPNSFPSW